MGLADKIVFGAAELSGMSSACTRLADEAVGLLGGEATACAKLGTKTESLLPPISRQLGTSSEYTAPGFIFNGSDNYCIGQIKSLRMPVDYRKMISPESRVTLFGETHPEVGMRDELINNMPLFKDMGFTHLGMEALTSRRQPLMDAFISGSHRNATDAAVTKVLKKDWGWTPDSYLELIDSAKSHGLKVMALDRKVTAQMERSWHRAQKWCEDSRYREEQWARLVTEKLREEPKARALMLVGDAHVGIDPAMPKYLSSMLKRNELNPTVISLSTTNTRIPSLFESAVLKGDMAYEKFAVPVTAASRPADFIVNIPLEDDFGQLAGELLESWKQRRLQSLSRTREWRLTPKIEAFSF